MSIGNRRSSENKRVTRLAAVVIILPVIAALAWVWPRSVSVPPGILAPDEPLQSRIEVSETIRRKGYTLTPVARFDVRARVLGRRNYHRDALSPIAPFDLAIGWGPMSDSRVLDALTVIQMNRFYRWQTDAYPIPRRDIIRHSTNIHIIPASNEVRRAVAHLKPGHVVRLNGRLVNFVAPDGTRAATSLSRTDAGMGACEILYAESVEVSPP